MSLTFFGFCLVPFRSRPPATEQDDINDKRKSKLLFAYLSRCTYYSQRMVVRCLVFRSRYEDHVQRITQVHIVLVTSRQCNGVASMGTASDTGNPWPAEANGLAYYLQAIQEKVQTRGLQLGCTLA